MGRLPVSPNTYASVIGRSPMTRCVHVKPGGGRPRRFRFSLKTAKRRYLPRSVRIFVTRGTSEGASDRPSRQPLPSNSRTVRWRGPGPQPPTSPGSHSTPLANMARVRSFNTRCWIAEQALPPRRQPPNPASSVRRAMKPSPGARPVESLLPPRLCPLRSWAIGTSASVRVLQIGSTPCSSRCPSMKLAIWLTDGRAPPARNARSLAASCFDLRSG